jgi:thiol-disulfide isomerase/thioredoxin
MGGSVKLAERQRTPVRRDLSKMSAGARRREEARRKARRKRQLKMYGIPAAIVSALLVVAVVVSLGGSTATPTTPAKSLQTTGLVTTNGQPRSEPLQAGERIPDFTANLLAGGTVRWASYQGTPTVLALWAPWCPHCQKELPILARVAQGFPQVKVLTLVTAADLHPGPTVDGFLQSHNLNLATALDDEAGTLGLALGLQAFPTVYYVDANGVVRHTIVGEASPEQMRANIQSLLG